MAAKITDAAYMYRRTASPDCTATTSPQTLLALFQANPVFALLFVLTRIHGSGRTAKKKKKQGKAWENSSNE